MTTPDAKASSPAPARDPAHRSGRWRSAAAATAGLWTIVVALPILDLLRGAPEFFVAHRADRVDLLTIVVVVVAVVPAAMALSLAAAASIGGATLDALAGVLVGLLLAIEALLVGYRLGLTSSAAAVPTAAMAAAAGAVAWWRSATVRRALPWLVLAFLAAPPAFLALPGIRNLLGQETSAAPPRTPSALAPVVVIVFDELPLANLLDANANIDATRHPHFAALAADGIWFRGATTVSDFTRWALAAILDGRYPQAGSLPTPADHPDTLFTRLAPTHRMEVSEPLTAICPPALANQVKRSHGDRLRRMLADIRAVAAATFLPPDARTGLPDFTEGWAGWSDLDEVRAAWRAGERRDPQVEADAFVDGIEAGDEQPTLYFLHSLVSHHPPRRLPSGQSIANYRTPPGLLRSTRWVEAQWPVTLFEQGTIVQAGAADRVVGRLRARLRETGLYDRALVVVTADHGMAFAPGAPARRFSDAGAAGIVPVPLIVKLPAGAAAPPPGTVDDRNVETIDILPTVLGVLGLPTEGPDGIPALGRLPPRTEKRLYFDDARQVRRYSPDEVAQLVQAEVRRKAETFGTGPWPSPMPPALTPLAGRPVTALSTADAQDARVQVDDLFALDDVDLSAPAVPVQLKGRVLAPRATATMPVRLAVAINGTIAALTETWSDDGRWLALVPPDSLRNGRNDLRIFVVDPERPGVLHAAEIPRHLPAGVDFMSLAAAEYGVSYRGFHHEEFAGTTRFHWTGAEARVTVPVDRSIVPSSIEIEILGSGPEGKPLRVLVDGCEIFAGRLPGGRWSRTLPLGTCAPRGDWTTIGLVTEAHRPGDRDRRRLGVALARLAFR